MSIPIVFIVFFLAYLAVVAVMIPIAQLIHRRRNRLDGLVCDTQKSSLSSNLPMMMLIALAGATSATILLTVVLQR